MGRKLVPGVDKIKEEWVKDRVKDILKSFDSLHWDMPPAAMYGIAGRHDFLIIQRGLFWSCETKCGKNKPTSLQAIYARDVYDAGSMSIWCNELDYEKVRSVAAYVDFHGQLPYDLADDFTEYL